MAKKKTSSNEIKTKIAKLDLTDGTDAGEALELKCENMGKLGYRLSATFTHVNELILIFQK
jgi:hypothetical protein